MRNWKIWPRTVGLLCASVMLATGCTTSAPANVAQLNNVLGDTLPGAQGKTRTDQLKIDETVAGGCGAGLYNKTACARHTVASGARKQQLKNEGPE